MTIKDILLSPVAFRPEATCVKGQDLRDRSFLALGSDRVVSMINHNQCRRPRLRLCIRMLG